MDMQQIYQQYQLQQQRLQQQQTQQEQEQPHQFQLEQLQQEYERIISLLGMNGNALAASTNNGGRTAMEFPNPQQQQQQQQQHIIYHQQAHHQVPVNGNSNHADMIIVEPTPPLPPQDPNASFFLSATDDNDEQELKDNNSDDNNQEADCDEEAAVESQNGEEEGDDDDDDDDSSVQSLSMMWTGNESDEDLDAHLEFLCQKQGLLERASRHLQGEELYNASIAHTLIRAGHSLQFEEPNLEWSDEDDDDNNNNENYDDEQYEAKQEQKLKSKSITKSCSKDNTNCVLTSELAESSNLWKEAKEVLFILSQRSDTGGRPPLIRKTKKKKAPLPATNIAPAAVVVVSDPNIDQAASPLPSTRRVRFHDECGTASSTGVPSTIQHPPITKRYKIDTSSVQAMTAAVYERHLEELQQQQALPPPPQVVPPEEDLIEPDNLLTAHFAAARMPSDSANDNNSSASSTASSASSDEYTSTDTNSSSSSSSSSASSYRRQPQRQEWMSNMASFVFEEGMWMAKALQKAHPNIPHQTRATKGWGIVSDPYTMARCLVPPQRPVAQNHDNTDTATTPRTVALHEVMAITSTPQVVTQSTPPFTVVHANRAFSLFTNLPAERIIGQPVETLVHVVAKDELTESSKSKSVPKSDSGGWMDSVIALDDQPVIPGQEQDGDVSRAKAQHQTACRIRIVPVLDPRYRRRHTPRASAPPANKQNKLNTKPITLLPGTPTKRTAWDNPVVVPEDEQQQEYNGPSIMSHVLIQVQPPDQGAAAAAAAAAAAVAASSTASGETILQGRSNGHRHSRRQRMTKNCLQEAVG